MKRLVLVILALSVVVHAKEKPALSDYDQKGLVVLHHQKILSNTTYFDDGTSVSCSDIGKGSVSCHSMGPDTTIWVELQDGKRVALGNMPLAGIGEKGLFATANPLSSLAITVSLTDPVLLGCDGIRSLQKTEVERGLPIFPLPDGCKNVDGQPRPFVYKIEHNSRPGDELCVPLTSSKKQDKVTGEACYSILYSVN